MINLVRESFEILPCFDKETSRSISVHHFNGEFRTYLTVVVNGITYSCMHISRHDLDDRMILHHLCHKLKGGIPA